MKKIGVVISILIILLTIITIISLGNYFVHKNDINCIRYQNYKYGTYTFNTLDYSKGSNDDKYNRLQNKCKNESSVNYIETVENSKMFFKITSILEIIAFILLIVTIKIKDKKIKSKQLLLVAIIVINGFLISQLASSMYMIQ